MSTSTHYEVQDNENANENTSESIGNLQDCNENTPESACNLPENYSWTEINEEPSFEIDPVSSVIQDEIASVNQQYLDTVCEDPEEDPPYREIEFSPDEIFKKIDSYNYAERWSDSTSQISLPGQVEDVTVTSDEPARNEPTSEMYYTASSEVSLLSDMDPEKIQEDDKEKEGRPQVIAGHVAAMRERFESMTRTNTPCPDLARSLSPSLEVFRNISPSPDRLA